ncbi:MAG: hypothetical protein QF464_14945, partial [Myxococcota bacterium]|nr:hypothetical protein [Myxococcota bacterium]
MTRLLFGLIGLLGLVASWVSPSLAEPTAASGGAVATSSRPDLGRYSLPKGTLRTKFSMRVLGMKVGEPEIHLGPLERTKTGAAIRKLRFQGGAWGKLRRLYPFDTSSVSIIDGVTYRPMRTVIKMLRGTSDRTLDMRFKGNR